MKVNALKRAAAGWFGRAPNEISAFSEELRRVGLIPTGAAGYGGSRSALVGEAECLAMVVALLSREGPRRAAHLVRDFLTLPFDSAHAQITIGTETSTRPLSPIAAFGGVDLSEADPSALTFGIALWGAIRQLRHRLGVPPEPASPEATIRPARISIGVGPDGVRYALVEKAGVTPDNRLETHQLVFKAAVPDGGEASAALAAPSFCSSVSTSILDEIAKLLGPLTASGGGVRIEPEVDDVGDEQKDDDELPLAARKSDNGEPRPSATIH